MKKFLKKIVWFSVPCMIVILLLIYVDFFKVFFSYDEYYSDDLIVTLNRETVCLRTLENIPLKDKPDSYIFGSSRSQAFKCKDWKNYITTSKRLYHFDAANEALIGVLNKLKYLDENNINVKNILFIVDIGLLKQTSLKSRNYSLVISPPELSDNSSFEFYKAFVSSSLNPKFVVSYIDFKTFKTHRAYMGQFIANTEFPNKIDEFDMDFVYGKDEEIESDSVGYYNKMINQGIFSKRLAPKVDTSSIKKEVLEQLTAIKSIFDKHKTNYKIVVSPMYNQVKLSSEYLTGLNSIFLSKNVFDYSGVNKFTNSIGNFYERSHYRPHVARSIMNEIYAK